MWGGSHTDPNGSVIEDLMEERELVCLNDGRGTRSEPMDIRADTTLGSDHYPIICSVGERVKVTPSNGVNKWLFHRADWIKFQVLCEEAMVYVNEFDSISCMNNQLTEGIIGAAQRSIPMSKNKHDRVLVPWWTDECRQAIKTRNRAFRLLNRTLSMQNLIQYRRAQAVVRRTIKQAKKASWRGFCSKIGRTTPVGQVWGMVKRMGGDRRQWDYPVLTTEEGAAVSDKEKAEAMVKNFAKVHSSENLSETAKGRIEQTKMQYPEALVRKVSTGEEMDSLFTMEEMLRALKDTKSTAPGKDQICYVMLKHLGKGALMKLLCLMNRVWIQGELPCAWKEAVIVPIRKPGKDPSKPANYRPIALTSNLCKLMERMITERLSFDLEKRGLLAGFQSGFRKARNTCDAVVRLENVVRKAEANKESVLAVFFDIEKAYDMLWREGLLIKLHQLGVGARAFNWVRDFLVGRKIQVRVGSAFSDQYEVHNGTPQGSAISPLLFIIMINDVFSAVPEGVGRSLFADDGALWKRGKNIHYLVNKVQDAIDYVVEWGLDWGFRFSVEKTKVMFFTRRKVSEALKLKLYGEDIERVNAFKFLGVVFDSRLTWKAHIDKIEAKSKHVINVMRCVAGREWGASCAALKKLYQALIRSVFDYGCVAYGSAAPSLLKRLDVEMGEMPLDLRRRQIAVNYWIHLGSHSEKLCAKDVLVDCWENEKNQRDHFGKAGNRLAKECCVFELRICPS
ncbi:hypothetical protein WMY93_031957 [Mugilogobius chulae]|uniref:Reverse transcriptase domain-containing protein n=1 Tax=Mugilogobius chulae TaxID=88201 RepID=A0AAW0MJN8_9GOBI